MQQYEFIRVNRLFKRYTPKHASTVCYIGDCDNMRNYVLAGTKAPHLLAKHIRNYLRKYKVDTYRLSDTDELVFYFNNKETNKIPKNLRRFIIDNRFKDVYFFAIGNFFPTQIGDAKRGAHIWIASQLVNGFFKYNLERGHCLRG